MNGNGCLSPYVRLDATCTEVTRRTAEIAESASVGASPTSKVSRARIGLDATHSFPTRRVEMRPYQPPM